MTTRAFFKVCLVLIFLNRVRGPALRLGPISLLFQRNSVLCLGFLFGSMKYRFIFSVTEYESANVIAVET